MGFCVRVSLRALYCGYPRAVLDSLVAVVVVSAAVVTR